jgi:hypothetical protein
MWLGREGLSLSVILFGQFVSTKCPVRANTIKRLTPRIIVLVLSVQGRLAIFVCPMHRHVVLWVRKPQRIWRSNMATL